MGPAPSYLDDFDEALAAYDANRAPNPAALPPPAPAPGTFAVRGGPARDPLGAPGDAPTSGAPPALASPPPPGVLPMREGPARDPLGAPGAAPPAARSQAFDDELPPLMMPRGRRFDPEAAAMLERRKPAPAGDPNRALKIVDALASGLSQSRTGKGYDTAYWGGVDQQRRTDADKARALEAADPNSAISKQQRAAMAPILGKLGLRSDEIGALSAADMRAMSSGGKIATVLAQSRERAAAAAAARKQDLDDAAAKRVQDDEQWAARNKVTSAQALERAQTMASTQGDAFARRMGAEEAARIRAEQRATARKTTEDETAAKRKRDDEARAAEKAVAGESAELDAIESELAELAKADPKGLLPGSEGKLEGVFVEGKKQVLGGSGRGDAESRLATKLDLLGITTYKNKSGGVVNEGERPLAQSLYRGDGTAASGLAAVRARKAAIAAEREKQKAAASNGGAGAAPAPPAGKLRLPNGATVADTPANRKSLVDQKIKFEVAK